MPYTVRDQITEALQEIGVAGEGTPIEPEELTKGLRALRRLYGSFNAQGLVLRTTTPTTKVLIASQQDYTVGVGGNINVDYPLWIPYATISPAGDTQEIPLVPYDTYEDWVKEPFKTLTDQYPRRFRYNRSYPLGVLTVWPVPTTGPTLRIYRPTPIAALNDDDPTALGTVLTFGPGEEDAWLLNLSKRLCRPFTRPLTADLVEDAREALGVLKRANDPGPPPARIDSAFAGSGRYDIQTNRAR